MLIKIYIYIYIYINVQNGGLLGISFGLASLIIRLRVSILLFAQAFDKLRILTKKTAFMSVPDVCTSLTQHAHKLGRLDVSVTRFGHRM